MNRINPLISNGNAMPELIDAASALNEAYSGVDSRLLWGSGDRVFRRGWRMDDAGQRQPVLFVQPAAVHPSRSSLDRLVHEYELRSELDRTWALRPLDLVRDAGRAVLILDDPGGIPLHQSLGQPVDVASFLRTSIGIAGALGKLHQRGLVHKDVKPDNLVVNATTGDVRLTGFGIASRLPRERQSPHPPETIAGTLAYMAPEQTGRMNRSIDSRSDLYALGVTLYQMITGTLPFTATEPMEWVHCHLAKRPAPPSTRREQIPGTVSAIIMKLLAKSAEHRYQTAAGLEIDLRTCEAEWRARGSIDDFALGESDAPDCLRIPEKIYGRQPEIDTLLGSFEKVVAGAAPELVLVSGYSGIGKSSLVNELQPVLVPPRGLFASGKFDQYKRDIPYATLAQAFQNLIRPLLAKDETSLAPWRVALTAALGPHAALIAELVPEIGLLVREMPSIPELAPQDAQRRFQLVFRKFIGVFARPEHPLALFLDDLQWLDSATLDLLEDVLSRSDLRNLLLIGAYRDNEVTPSHPLMRRLESIRATGRVQDIKLAPLTSRDVSALVRDSLRCNPEQAEPLAALVHAKTDGNPFFVIQFLHALAGEHLLAFDHDLGRWTWDLARIHAKRYTDNVVDLLAVKLTRLLPPTQHALRQLACLGNAVDVSILSIVLECPEEDVHAALLEAVRQQLIDKLGRTYKFVHDRVHEAAYALIPQDSRALMHLTIGRILAQRTPPEARDAVLFEIVNQFNRGATLITSIEECEHVAELNLAAGLRAKASTAYSSALTYLSAGATLLPGDAWERRQELAFALAMHSADCELCLGALQSGEERLAALAMRAVGTVQRCAAARRRIDLYYMLEQGERAVGVGLECLRQLGIDWPTNPTEAETRREYERVWSLIGSRSMERIVDMPPLQDPETLALIDVLIRLSLPAEYVDENLVALSTCRAANLSLERGNSDAAPVSYAAVGLIASARFGDHDDGYRLAKMACDLVEHRGWNHSGGRTYNRFAVVIPWTRPLTEAIEPSRRSFQMAKEHGEPAFAALACRSLVSILIASGDRLEHAQHEAEQGLEFVLPFGFFLDRMSAPLALARMLRGSNRRFGSLDDGRFTEHAFEERITGRSTRAFLECHYWIRKLQARFFAGDYAAAMEAAEKADVWYSTSAPLSLLMLEKVEFHFYAALTRAARCEPVGPDPYALHREALQRHEQQLRAWANDCPQNFADRTALVGAEIARLEARTLDAMELYKSAIAAARLNGFVQNEAIAYELAARCYTTQGFDDIAHLYLDNARQRYVRWGADGKARQLEQLHPRLREEDRVPTPAGTIEAPIERLDLDTVIAVSQALSGEIDSERLLDRLMRSAIEHAGAERGLLILPRGDSLQIEAQATLRDEAIAVQIRDSEPGTTVPLPESLIRFTLRTREPVILDDASSHNPYSADPYIVQRRARSVLCVPLLIQQKLLGALYLENNLTSHVFTPGRVTVLKVLASQAAVSLENAHLYREQKQAQDALHKAGAELAHVSRVTALSALTASIAHEVNQPLAGIITNGSTCVRMLNADPPNVEGARETVRRILRDGNRASDVIARLRALFTKREFTVESLDLNEATREVIALLSNDLQRNNIALQQQLADDLPTVTGDRVQLQQVILNLVRNASDAMTELHDRSRQVTIKTEVEPEGELVRWSVRDSGVGLPEKNLESLFNAFRTTKSGGMGIGLFVSRSIIDRHNGRLWAQPNDDGPGATFCFAIPRG